MPTAEEKKDGKRYLITGPKMWMSRMVALLMWWLCLQNRKRQKSWLHSLLRKTLVASRWMGGKKMGIKVHPPVRFFQRCKVPVENMLSERENGFKIAVNVLNIGQIKLGISTVGGSKFAMNAAVKYSKERKQFNQSISNFGAIKYKIAEMASRIFCIESAHYRAGQNIDDAYEALVAGGMESGKANWNRWKSLPLNMPILKSARLEVLDYTVGWRRARFMVAWASQLKARWIARIAMRASTEGTNEINAFSPSICWWSVLWRAQSIWWTPPWPFQKRTGWAFLVPAGWRRISCRKRKSPTLKKAGLMVAGAAVQKFMMKLSDEQEILMNLPTWWLKAMLLNRTLLRVEKLVWWREAVRFRKRWPWFILHHAIEKAATGRSD